MSLYTSQFVSHEPHDPASARHVSRVRLALDRSLTQWWTSSSLPPLPLLRDALLVLEAGYPLDEPQRTLLLRAALAHQRGVVTALRHQTDGERTATALAEAICTEPRHLTPEDLKWLLQNDPKAAAWSGLLAEQLAAMLAGAGVNLYGVVQRAMAVLTQEAALAALVTPAATEHTRALLLVEEAPTQPSSFRFFFAAAIAFIVVATVAWQLIAAGGRDKGVTVPAGVYTLSDRSTGEPQSVTLAAFVIDRTEVTNHHYRACSEQKACAWPAVISGATRPGYLLDPAYADFPVIMVTWSDAAAYCAWRGQRLPTAAEWQVAASLAPTTDRLHPYPWGARFEGQRANTAESANSGADTMAVGSYSPFGDSALGLADMAGNVSEWTADLVQSAAGGAAVVKGGSYRDSAAAVRADAWVELATTSAEPWLGFRCVANGP